MGFWCERGIKLPLPPEPTVGLTSTSPPRRWTTEQYAEEGPPKFPKFPFPPLAVQFEFRVFPDSPEHKMALQGLRTASGGVGFLGIWGFTGKLRAKVQAPVPGNKPAGERSGNGVHIQRK
jgi:hypothetical protein